MRGDRVEVLVDVGDGVRTFDVEATKAGRRVEVNSSRGTVDVVEVTRTGKEIRTASFMSNRVVAIVEHPAGEEDRPTPRSQARRDHPGQEGLGL